MMIYVYQLSNGTYSAGLNEKSCAKRGRIVERWPVRTPKEAKFTATHGTSFKGASEKVTRLADLAHELLMEDPALQDVIDPRFPVPKHFGLWKRLKLAISIVLGR